jgi:hypothetical protein
MQQMAYLPDAPLIYRLPVLGRIVREVADGDADNKWYLLVALLSLLVLAVATWGLPALVLTAVVAAPLCILMLVLITLG